MKALVLALTLLILSSCGTDTGNPGFRGPASGVGGSIFMSPAMCSKLSSCYPSLTYGNCVSGVLTAPGITGAMGLSASTYPNLSSAYNGVASGDLRVNQTTLDQCSSAILGLTCASATVTSAYSISQPTNFNNAYNLLSASSACQNTIAP